MSEFNFPYYTRRWGCNVSLNLTKTENGWYLQKEAHSGPCEPDGSPHLIGNFRQDVMSYPADVGRYLEHIWNELDAGEIDDDRAQEMLTQLGQWVAECEQRAPKWYGWN